MTTLAYPFPRLQNKPDNLEIDNPIQLEIQEGMPILRESQAIQERIQTLLQKLIESGLSAEEAAELDWYEEMDDYLNFVNGIASNRLQDSLR